MSDMKDLTAKVEAAFDRAALKRICEMGEEEFAAAYDMTRVAVDQKYPADFYYYKDNGSPILAVAHLDTVVDHHQRLCNFIETAGGPIVYSGALDDRLGAYIILELMPALGIEFDLLLTVGEESGCSTAAFFEPSDHHDRAYNWMIEFDRGGSDVVLYQYEDNETSDLVWECGARVSVGAFSDISYLEHLRIKGFNWGVGYQDYHSVRGHAYLEDTIEMAAFYLRFHELNATVPLPHLGSPDPWYSRGRANFWDDEKGRCESCSGWSVDPETDWCEACGTCNACFYDGVNNECQCPWAIADREAKGRAESIREIENVWTKEGVL